MSSKIVKPLLVSVSAAIGSRVLFGEAGGAIDLPLLGSVGVMTAVAGSAFVASMVAQVGESYVLPYLPNNGKFASIEAKAVSPVLTGLAVSAILYPTLQDGALWKAFVLGAGSQVAGDYGYQVIDPILQNLLLQ